jgi:hypothetical protein
LCCGTWQEGGEGPGGGNALPRSSGAVKRVVNEATPALGRVMSTGTSAWASRKRRAQTAGLCVRFLALRSRRGVPPRTPPSPIQSPGKKLGRRRRPVFLPLSYKLRKAPPRHTRRGRWFGGVRPSFSGSVCETVWSSPARNAGRGARRPPPSRAICSDAFRGSKSDLRPLRLPGNVSGQAPPIERAKLDAQQSGIAIEGRRASWRRREPRSRHC